MSSRTRPPRTPFTPSSSTRLSSTCRPSPSREKSRLGRDRGQVNIIHSPVEKLAGEGLYDFIISGLPLNNFPVAQVREIYRVYRRLLKPGGTLSYYEYVWIRQLKTPFVDRRERRRLYRLGKVVGSYIRNYQVRREQVLMNVPPAIVRHLRLRPARVVC